jgi:zinc protease
MAALKHALNDPGQVAARRFRLACYGGHPYGRPIGGEIETLPTITRDDVDAMGERAFARNTLKIACVGAITPAELEEAVERTFGILPEIATLSVVPDVSVRGGDSLDLVRLDVPQSTILFGRQGLSRSDPDFDAATVVNHCLGSGMTSRLFREVREKRGLCYSIGTQNLARAHAAQFHGQTATSNERVSEAIGVIRDQMKRLAENGLGSDELDRAKRYLTGSYALQFDTSAKISRHLCEIQLQGREISRLDTRNAAIEAVSGADAARTASRLIGNGDLIIAIAGMPANY